MPCWSKERVKRERNFEALAERGISEEEIALLEAQVKLAQEKAKADSFAKGETLKQQQRAMQEAWDKAVDDWDLEMHARLERAMEEINILRKMTIPAGVGHD